MKNYTLSYKKHYILMKLSMIMSSFKKDTNKILTTKDSVRHLLKTFTSLSDIDIDDITLKVSSGIFDINDYRVKQIREELINNEVGNAQELLEEMFNSEYLLKEKEIEEKTKHIYNLFKENEEIINKII